MGNYFYHPPWSYPPPVPDDFSIGEQCIIEKAIID